MDPGTLAKITCKSRRMELPLKKRYHGHDSNAFTQLVSSASPVDDRASSDDSALPKTPCSGQSSSSSLIDVDDCAIYALDFTLPTRVRAKGKDDLLKTDHPDHDAIDHGFESASTSSVTSVQEEPLDLTEKPPPNSDMIIRSRPNQPISDSSFAMSIFGPAFLPFSLGSIDANIPNMMYPNFLAQTASNAQMTIGQPPAAKRPKLASQKSKKDVQKATTVDVTTMSPVVQEKANHLSQAQLLFDDESEDDQMNRLRRNYKNMTVERRMEANARERTRVHTIGAAFDRLRKLIPSSTSEQKLSKLSILRISCRYIMLLASMNGLDYSLEQRAYSVQECIDMLSDTINVESKFKRVP